MKWLNARFKLIAYFLLAILSQDFRLAEALNATSVRATAVMEGSNEEPVFQSDGSAGTVSQDVTTVNTQGLVRSRTLKQRTGDLQDEDEFECGLSSSERRRYFDDASNQWLVTNEVLRELDNDIQAIVNCSSENDVVVFHSTRVTRPARTITLPWNLTFRADSSVTFICPRRGPLLVARASSVTLENLVVASCNGSSSVIVLSPRCDNEMEQGMSLLRHLTFRDNGVFEEGHIIEANGRCSRLNISGVVFLRNGCIGTHCVILGAMNTLTNIYLANNQGSNETSLDSSMFFGSTGSETVATNATSLNNTIRSFYITNSTMRTTDSRFDGNRRIQSSSLRDNSIGGGVLFSQHSSISFNNTIFQRNYAFNGGALFAWSSNVSISKCTFRENDASEGNGGALYGHYNSSFDVSASVFSKNHGYQGAGLYSNYTQRVDMTNISVWENNCSRSCAVWIVNGIASIRSSEFLRNSADRASAALCTAPSKLSLDNSTFIGNMARFGGACLFESNSTVDASSLLFENNTAWESHGGGIFFLFSGYMRIRDSTFQNNNAFLEGGAIHAWGECQTVLKRVIFLNNTSGDYGGALQVRSRNFNGSDLTFRRNYASNFGGAISFFEANSVSVSRSNFEGNIAGDAGAILFHFTSSGYIDRCTFSRNVGRKGHGGALRARVSNINISSSTFLANSSPYGGSISLFNRCNSTILNSRFENSTAELLGGAISMSSNCSLVLSNSSFSRNRAIVAGALDAASSCNISVSRVEFVENYGSSGGCIRFRDFGVGTVSDSLFSNNVAQRGGGAIDLYNSFELTMSNSTLVGNSGGTFGGGVMVSQHSKLHSTNVTFSTNRAMKGGALHLLESGNATLSNCAFTNNTASIHGGAICQDTNSTTNVNNSIFSGNQANSGGGICVENNSTASLSFNIFAKNNASTLGGGVYVHSSNVVLMSSHMDLNRATSGGSLVVVRSVVKMTNLTIGRSRADQVGGAIVVSETNATLKTVHLELNQALEIGGGIFALLGSRIDATNVNVVSNLAGYAGGGIALSNASSLLCFSCLILNNRAFSGAGLYVHSNNSIPIVAQLQNSRFENNTARSHGGGIEFVAPQSRSINCSTPIVTCDYIVLLNTSFVDNFASHTGAILLTTDAKRVLVDCESKRRQTKEDFLNKAETDSLKMVVPRQLCTSWKRNSISSREHGDLVGTFGKEVELTIDPEDGVTLVGSMASGYVLENVRSGRQLPTINVTILDGYGVGPAPTVPLTFEARLSSSDGFLRGSYVRNISVGSGSFVEVVGFAQPGNYTLMFMLDNPALEAFNVTAIVRECQIGEEPTRNRLGCQECDSVNYNFNPHTPSGCRQCPQNANCTGRYIVPNKGHWHKSPCHDTIQSCLIKEACSYKDRRETLTNFTQNSTDCKTNESTLDSYNDALCNDGYKGPLCGSCKKSYGLSFRFQCFTCPRRFISVFTLLGLTLYLLVSSAITIRGTLPSPPTKPRRSSTRGRPNNGPGSTSFQHAEIKVESEESVPQDSNEDEESGIKSKSIVTRSPSKPMNGYELLRWKTTEILKILINFLQTIAVAATVNVQWTDGVLEVFEASEYMGLLTTAASSGPIDCLISSDSPKTRSVARILLTLLVPGIVIGIFLTFWSCMTYKRKQSIRYFCKRSLLSVIAVTYISYLGLTQLAVRMFYCVDVYDSTDPFIKIKSKYWAVDTAVTCYGNAHSGLITIGVILLLFVSFGFPLVSALVLTQTKVHDRQSAGWQLETMGFLYRAFKEEFVYWESVVMLRKAFLSVIVVFSYPLGGQIQGLLAALVIVFGLYFHQTCAPFRQEFSTLNRYEAISLLVSCVTFILGQFFNADRSSDATKTLIAVFIIVVNTSFFAFLVFVLIKNVIEQLRESLQNTNANVSQDTPWWKVVIVFITSRLSAICCSKK